MAELKSKAPTVKSQAPLSTAIKSSKMRVPEVVGILSQSLHPSPTIRLIVPARIRSRTQNDVVFVGENFIQLREFLPTGQLAEITAKVDLGSQILSAKAISSRAWTQADPYIDEIIEQQLDSDYHDIKAAQHGVKRSDQESFPPQLLVVSTVACNIVFLFAKDRAPGVVEFVFAKRRLLADTSGEAEYLKHLAVDHESRAMAVASSFGFCAIFNLKEAHDIAREVESSTPARLTAFNPFLEERFIKMDGIVLKMDFLPPPPHVKDQVMLLLLVAQRNGTYIHVYSWDTRLGLGNAKPNRCSGQRLPFEDSHPLMLIPSTQWTSFVVVTETEIVVYDDILSPRAKRINLPLTDQYPPAYENSTRTPLWVQWTKPTRHARYNMTHDDICLVREDGQLRYYIIDRATPTKIDAHFRPGNLGVNVDTAFASMQGPVALGGGDTFIVGGDLTDGGVFQCIAKNAPTCTQIIPNISPVHDMLTINSHDHSGSKALRDPDRRERIFVCSGRGTGHTSVSEIRYGLEAQIGLSADYGNLSSANQVWTLSDTQVGKVVFIISHAQHTTAVSLYLVDFELEVADSESFPGIDLTTSTLASAVMDDDTIIQVTQTAVNITAFTPHAPKISKPYPCQIVAAAITRALGMFATASETPAGFEIRLSRVSSRDSALDVYHVGEAVHLSHIPTALAFADHGPSRLLVVGTVTGLLCILSVDQISGLTLVAEHSLTGLLKHQEMCTVSSLAVLRPTSGVELGLLCGLRTGLLVCLNVDLDAPSTRKPGLVLACEYSLGRTSVTVVPDSADHGAALVFCAKELRRVKLLEDFSPPEYSIGSVWLTSREDPSYQQPSVNALVRLDSSSSVQELGMSGSLLCITDDQILISSMMLDTQAIPRRLRTKGNPQRLTYSRHLNKLIVALDEVSFDGGGTLEHPLRRRKIRPALQFIDPDESMASSAEISQPVIRVGEAAESITVVMNWTPSDGKKHYEMIVIGIEVDSPDTEHSSGRLLCLSAKDAGDGAVLDVKPKYIKKFPGQPIRSLCAYDLSSLLVCAGNELFLMQLDIGVRRWLQVAKFVLPSPAVALTTRGSLIYAATMHHSMEILECIKGKLILHSSDLQARNANSIIACQNGAAILSSISTDAKGGRITGFSAHTVHRESKVIFHADLPLMVTTLQAGYNLTSDDASRQCVYASTLDGTMYYLATLNQHEWQLLYFLQCLIKQGQPGASLRRRRPRRDTLEAPKRAPEDMHIHGEIVAQLLGRGTPGLRNLLAQEINGVQPLGEIPESRDERQAYFHTLVHAVIGDSADPLGGVSRWLRSLLRN